MKIQLIAAAVSFSLASCASINNDANNGSGTSRVNNANVQVFAKEVSAKPAANISNGDKVITLEKIMADPDWFGRAPESWYWGDDSNTIYYKQKREGNPLRDLYRQTLSNGDAKNPAAQAVTLAELHRVSDRFAQLSQDGSKEVYAFDGNIFVKDLSSGQITQLTKSSANESNPQFLTTNSKTTAVAYRIGNTFYRHDLASNLVTEIASLKASGEPKGVSKPKSYLAKEQHQLIDYVALQQRNKELRYERNQALKAENTTIANHHFYFGDDVKIVHASLSPAGDKIVVSVTKDTPLRAKTDIMPNYVTSSGDIDPVKVRRRVADNRKYSEKLYLVDLHDGSKTELSYESLPGFDQDVLAEVRKENHARKGERYQSEKQARNIHVMQTWTPIQWHNNGKQVALLLEAWDNKDRWLTTIDFEQKTLVNQHRLHDDAWINYTFNEFGWFNGSERLYYLSEESGYSQLYQKPLNGKAQQLTQGKFEVSDLTLTRDDSKVVFKANKKHPGIYEIYQVNTENGELTALTDLGGMNDYQLSPDESKLLVEHSTVTMPPELYVKNLQSTEPSTRVTYTVSDEFLAMPWSAPNVVAIPSSHQSEPIYSKVYLPKNFDASDKKNRAVMFSHGAGYLQNSHLGWSGYFREYMFHSMLVQQGYVVIDMDYRASKGYGRDWRTAIYRHMGEPEVQDMLDGVNWLVENANVDAKRIGTYGGSYGGFLTLMALFKEPEVFQSGSALRLVSDWAYYNHGYTSNILNTPEDDAIAYERSSPIYFAEGLNKPLLINAPMIDDNVFFQDTVRLVQRLIELEKQDFETAIYPVEPHGFVQPSSWLNEYRRIYKLFEETL
ncbi:S9 family peptidase [Endozoicomonas sp. G2_1]|uniref:S9 family peptidase n=1 Tax=Endozoicomonas sp. G2_1 TaxID=2821091 RepID=UPI001ADC049A|nr:prolyl oligopeptidase family serine peptidase [Endozoicomonas sp. G2_1]MBO9490839.1 S9 family peptidase [Endozoicomonas sp. G2_1]